MSVPASLCFFFFQAEDGIRDTSVTGVQTCALPIFNEPSAQERRLADNMHGLHGTTTAAALAGANKTAARSEERRVGKECRTGGWAGEEKKKGENRVDDRGIDEGREVASGSEGGVGV